MVKLRNYTTGKELQVPCPSHIGSKGERARTKRKMLFAGEEHLRNICKPA